MQSNGSLLAIISIILGAFGAFIAIYLKEALQLAIRKRTLTWQLSAYLTRWQAIFTRDLTVFTLYQKVRTRSENLASHYLKGTDHFQTEWDAQREQLTSIKKQ
jgi:hypothetical protein